MPKADTLSSPIAPVDTHEVDLAAGRSQQVIFTPAERAQVAQIVHREFLESRTYAGIVRDEASCVGTARLFVEASLEELAPRDPIERMLAVQMLWQHARLAQLIRQAGGEVRPEILRSLNAAIDSGMNTSRRQAEAWDRLRAGRPTQLIRGGQVNVGELHIVTNQVGMTLRGRADLANKQGLEADEHTTSQLPIDAGGPRIAQDERATEATVGAQHGPEDRERQEYSGSECPEARPTKCDG